ncbi:MAG TPA: asparagine synthase (glutamine-hydrolyzing) [Bryobacteraceae bacterium]|nr:asparagine synthase (glutamine-hydrolyzing) [Bryobacteraceae bacterium]
MCGICGTVERVGTAADAAVLVRMNSRLWHRGPDEGGEWTDGEAGLAMRRLAIIDLSGGHQPMFNEDGTIAIVFNGEIYNFSDLQQELEAAGHRFATRCDTETVIHLYEEYGPGGLQRLNGMFALAIWDRRQRELLLARDRAGKKPLYYAAQGSRIAFSSELASLLEYPGIGRDPDPVALDNYFCLGYVPAPRTVFREVKQLEPGHYLRWKAGPVESGSYWRLHPRSLAGISEQEAAQELLRLLEDAVRIRLHSDVPFGALLSGGVDSSLVVGLMSRLMDRPVQTFTIGFSEEELNESQYAAEVARLFGTDHHNLIAGPHSVIDLVQKLTAHFGEPFADASAVPTYLVSEMARKHVTMALSGDGGDEVFGGYQAYRYHACAATYRKLPAGLRNIVRTAAQAVNGSGGHLGSRLQRFVEESELPVGVAWQHSRSVFTDAELAALYTPAFAEQVQVQDRGFQIQQSFQHFGPADRAAAVLNHVDYETYLPGDILVKVDRMSMANSLEIRSPLLDYRVAEFAAGLPREWKWTALAGKRILKRAAEAVLPRRVLGRRKQGFVLPIASWFRNELRPFLEEAISTSRSGQIIRLDYCRQLLDRHVESERGITDRKLWSVLCYLLWHEKFAR